MRALMKQRSDMSRNLLDKYVREWVNKTDSELAHINRRESYVDHLAGDFVPHEKDDFEVSDDVKSMSHVLLNIRDTQDMHISTDTHSVDGAHITGWGDINDNGLSATRTNRLVSIKLLAIEESLKPRARTSHGVNSSAKRLFSMEKSVIPAIDGTQRSLTAEVLRNTRAMTAGTACARKKPNGGWMEMPPETRPQTKVGRPKTTDVYPKFTLYSPRDVFPPL